MYNNYYGMLCNQVFLIVKDRYIAEDIVQDVFSDIWKKRENLNIHQSFTAYLKKTCRNRTLNYIRDNNIKWEDDSAMDEILDTGLSSDDILSLEQLNLIIQDEIAQLPEKCGIIFSLSRFEDMSYNEIAKSLNISVKTVENQISKALRILREKIYKNKYIE
ncbi:MAG: RNA polymerase sigma-70 factor [Saprospiraceae bacterium]|nr:RNA polymerase sigma-70 factor [Saprospiraceae bacterium]